MFLRTLRKSSSVNSMPRRFDSARMSAKPSSGVVVGKMGILTSTRPGRLRSTSIRSGRLDARTQTNFPRLSVLLICSANML